MLNISVLGAFKKFNSFIILELILIMSEFVSNKDKIILLFNARSEFNSTLNKILSSNFVNESFSGVDYSQLLTNAATNYLNPCTIIDMYYSADKDLFLITNVQNVLDQGTTNFFISF
jgi:hypothetical protein